MSERKTGVKKTGHERKRDEGIMRERKKGVKKKGTKENERKAL